MATGFEWLPFMGLLRIAQVDMIVFGLFALIFVPTIVVPSIWGLAVTVREFINTRTGDFAALSLFINGSLMLFLPFSTFREPFGLVRIATGLILAIIVFAGARELKRPLNYGLFWITLLVLLVQG